MSTPPASENLPEVVTPASRKYPYQVVNRGVMIPPEKLFAMTKEPAWENAKVKDTMVEYMRRAAEEELGEDGEAEAVELDSSKPLQLRCKLPGTTPEEMNTILAQLQTMGLNASVTLKPATVPEIRQMCDRICALAERIAESSDEEDALGFVLDALISVRQQMETSQQLHQ